MITLLILHIYRPSILANRMILSCKINRVIIECLIFSLEGLREEEKNYIPPTQCFWNAAQIQRVPKMVQLWNKIFQKQFDQIQNPLNSNHKIHVNLISPIFYQGLHFVDFQQHLMLFHLLKFRTLIGKNKESYKKREWRHWDNEILKVFRKCFPKLSLTFS